VKAAGRNNNPTRGIFVVTKAGRDLLATKPEKINLKILNTCETYQQFRSKHKPQQKNEGIELWNEEKIKTPEEEIEEAYELLRYSLADQTLEQLKGASATFFEKVVVEVLVKMGYGGTRKDSGQATGSHNIFDLYGNKSK
jgi:restriction system protein